MRFQAEHRFHGPPAAVAALLADAHFYVDLELPDLGQPQVLESHADGQQSRLRLRYVFTGSLDPMARRLLGEKRLAWIQQVVVDRSAGTGQLTFNAEADPRRLHGSAEFSLTATDEGCMRRLAGELIVSVPVIGSRAERAIVPGLLRRLDIEAGALNAALRQRPA